MEYYSGIIRKNDVYLYLNIKSLYFNFQDNMIPRIPLEKRIFDSIESSFITALLGPRQCGKTTIAKSITEKLKSSDIQKW